MKKKKKRETSQGKCKNIYLAFKKENKKNEV